MSKFNGAEAAVDERLGLRQRHLPSTPNDKPSSSPEPLGTPSERTTGKDSASQSSGLKSRLTVFSHVLKAYSPSRIIAEDKAQHQVKAKLDVVHKGDSVTLKYLDDDGNTGSLIPEELCAIRYICSTILCTCAVCLLHFVLGTAWLSTPNPTAQISRAKSCL